MVFVGSRVKASRVKVDLFSKAVRQGVLCSFMLVLFIHLEVCPRPTISTFHSATARSDCMVGGSDVFLFKQGRS